MLVWNLGSEAGLMLVWDLRLNESVMLEFAKRYRCFLSLIRDALQEISRGQAFLPLYLFASLGRCSPIGLH